MSVIKVITVAAYRVAGEVEGQESPKERAKDVVDSYLGGVWKDCGTHYLAVEDEQTTATNS